MIKGHCECGKANFEAGGEPTEFSHCHCSQCRRLSGAAFASFVGVKAKEFKYATGQDIIKRYKSTPKNMREFCGECGSNILVKSESWPDDFYVCMGSVDVTPKLPDSYHFFTASKAYWYEILDGAPQLEEGE